MLHSFIKGGNYWWWCFIWPVWWTHSRFAYCGRKLKCTWCCKCVWKKSEKNSNSKWLKIHNYYYFFLLSASLWKWISINGKRSWKQNKVDRLPAGQLMFMRGSQEILWRFYALIYGFLLPVPYFYRVMPSLCKHIHNINGKFGLTSV